MPVTVSRPINGIDGDEHLLDESGKPIEFETVKEAIRFLADHNFTISDLAGLDFHVEEPEENPCLLTAITGE